MREKFIKTQQAESPKEPSPMPDSYAPPATRRDGGWVITEVIDGEEFGVLKLSDADLTDHALQKMRRSMWAVKEALRHRKEWSAYSQGQEPV